jgi:hypothetical protein
MTTSEVPTRTRFPGRTGSQWWTGPERLSSRELGWCSSWYSVTVEAGAGVSVGIAVVVRERSIELRGEEGVVLDLGDVEVAVRQRPGVFAVPVRRVVNAATGVGRVLVVVGLRE